MAVKAKKFKVIRNPDLVAAARGFVPEFGSEEDLRIVNSIMAFDKLLETVDNEILRGESKKHTKKMKDILFKERSLIASITRRNNDF